MGRRVWDRSEMAVRLPACASTLFGRRSLGLGLSGWRLHFDCSGKSVNYFGYVRVSGASQVDGDGEARQLESIKGFLAQAGGALTAHVFEKAVSGTVEAMERPAFVDLLAFVKPGDAIVVERLDRVARDLMVQEFFLRECRARGLQVFAADQGMLDLASNDGDPTRKLIRQVLGALAEWEKSALVLKLRKARERSGHLGGSRPYGDTPAERQIQDLIRRYRVLGFGWPTVAEHLNNEGFLTRKGRSWDKWAVRTAVCGPRSKRHKTV